MPNNKRPSLDERRVAACCRACDGIPTHLLEKYGRRAFVREIALIPAGQEAIIHEILSPPLNVHEKVVGFRKCPHCKMTRAITEADEPPTYLQIPIDKASRTG